MRRPNLKNIQCSNNLHEILIHHYTYNIALWYKISEIDHKSVKLTTIGAREQNTKKAKHESIDYNLGFLKTYSL